MTLMVNLLQIVGVKSVVTDVLFGTIGTLATAVEEDFLKYMDGFAPYLNNALNNHTEPAICSMAIGIVSDITRALGEKLQPFCDGLMNSLLGCLNVCTMNLFRGADINYLLESSSWGSSQASYS